MSFKDWADLDPLVIPINGKKYQIPEIGWRDELKIRKQTAAVEEAVRNETELPTPMDNEEFLLIALGEKVLKQLRADNVPAAAITKAAFVSHCNILHGREVAEYVWNEGMRPEALAASIQKAANEVRQASTPSPSTGGAKKTPSPASTKATTSRQATRRAPKKAPASTRTSSSSRTRV